MSFAAAAVLAAACSPPPATAPGSLVAPEPAAPEPLSVSPLERAQAAVAAIVVPPVVTVREAVQHAAPALPPAPPPLVYPGAVALIVEFEVTGRAHYDRRLQGVIWPGGASGATWGIGYDGGHQTRPTIEADWAEHDQVERLATTAGITGERARALLPGLADVRTGWVLANDVFVAASLPVYHDRARRAFGPANWDRLPAPASGALVSLVYNRGASMTGDARLEMRTIRDTCLPAGDTACIAAELRAMCRLWAGTPNGPGLCRRRHAEADLAIQPPGDRHAPQAHRRRRKESQAQAQGPVPLSQRRHRPLHHARLRRTAPRHHRA